LIDVVGSPQLSILISGQGDQPGQTGCVKLPDIYQLPCRLLMGMADSAVWKPFLLALDRPRLAADWLLLGPE